MRLTKIYTRMGDKGTTRLGHGQTVDKDHPRIEACGAVDELNSMVGLILTEEMPDSIHKLLTTVQHHLFDLGAELCIPGHTKIQQQHIEFLEQELDALNATLEPLKEFILPGGASMSSTCHLARTVCRRAERRIVSLSKSDSVSPHTIQYINRLSDVLFVVARSLNKSAGLPDTLWQPADVDPSTLQS
ncbi:MAG: cob(I)yrinic acid a,c-diamide adenosyltransferase [Kiritimatiellae bacterium]|nr:cob(I)yrinic acid a,c-diamide adenosyltransferase [Kiritimatiellia bacterium]